jgi:hypothetical protein
MEKTDSGSWWGLTFSQPPAVSVFRLQDETGSGSWWGLTCSQPPAVSVFRLQDKTGSGSWWGLTCSDYKTRQVVVCRNNESRSCSHCCSGKAIGITCSECMFVAYLSSIQCAYEILYYLIWVNSIFPHFFTNGTIFDQKNLLNINCVFWFSLQSLSGTFLILRTERHIIKNMYCSLCEVPIHVGY